MENIWIKFLYNVYIFFKLIFLLGKNYYWIYLCVNLIYDDIKLG